MRLKALELFAGIGGESLALRAAGIRTAAYCEINPWCQEVLRSNMARGHLDKAPIFPDVKKLRGVEVGRAPQRGKVSARPGVGFENLTAPTRDVKRDHGTSASKC